MVARIARRRIPSRVPRQDLAVPVQGGASERRGLRLSGPPRPPVVAVSSPVEVSAPLAGSAEAGLLEPAAQPGGRVLGNLGLHHGAGKIGDHPNLALEFPEPAELFLE